MARSAKESSPVVFLVAERCTWGRRHSAENIAPAAVAIGKLRREARRTTPLDYGLRVGRASFPIPPPANPAHENDGRNDDDDYETIADNRLRISDRALITGQTVTWEDVADRNTTSCSLCAPRPGLGVCFVAD